MNRDRVIDGILNSMEYAIEYDFEFLWRQFDMKERYGGYSDYKVCLDQMVHEGLVNLVSNHTPEVYEGGKLVAAERGESVSLALKGKLIKEVGGWIKHKKLNRPPITSNKWFSITGWVVATIAGLVAIFQPFKTDEGLEIQRQEFINSRRPQLNLQTSAFYGTDPLLNGTTLQDTIGITGSYWLTNDGDFNITLERVETPNDLRVRGYFTDRKIDLPYTINPAERLLITCDLPNKSRPITRTESALKGIVVFTCSNPAVDVKYQCKFTWDAGAGLFLYNVRVDE
jgi:hypothetical protein